MRVRVLVWIAVLGLALALTWIGRARVLGEPRRTLPSDTVRVALRDFESTVKATGVVKPTLGSEIHVGAQLSALVSRLHVRTGDSVRRGQLLLELDARTLRAQEQRALAALDSANANLRYASSDWQRQSQLVESGTISIGALELVERTRALAQASVNEAQAQLAYTRSQLADARVLSPIAGVVAAVDVREGERAPDAPGSGLVTVIDLARLEIWAYVDETDVGKIQPQQAVEFSVESYPNETFHGEVKTIYPKPEIRDNVVNYITVIELRPVEQRTLRPEMTANVRIVLGRHAQALGVPRRVAHHDHDQYYATVVVGTARERRPITLGLRDDNYVEVTRGLKLGEQVLLHHETSEESNRDPSP